MSMTLVNAKIYVARVIGGAQSQEVLDQAGEAINRGYSDWEAQKYWRFLLKDTSAVTLIAAGTITNGSAVVAPLTTAGFDCVNIGQTVLVSTASSPAASLTAGTTVSSITRGTDGVITSITLSNAFAVVGGGVTTTSGVILSFSADIPVIAGTNEYNLPADYNAGATAKFILTNKSQTFIYRTQEYWDRIHPDETIRGGASEFTDFNPVSENTQNFGTPRLKFDRIPDVNDTLRLRYFRKFNTTGTNIDMPDQYLYKFLDYCRALLLEGKRAQDDPKGFRDSVLDSFQQAQQNDEDRNSESDADDCIKSQFEMGFSNTPLWGNGQFDPYR